MTRLTPIIVLLFFASVPWWLTDQYLLHTLITTGIFILAAMSLNLLLGYTGQLSLGHVAFFGIGAYTSALTALGFDVELFGLFRVVHEPWPPVLGLLFGTLVAALCGFVIGKLSFRVRGAYFVIVTISFAEVTRLVSLNWVELDAGPARASRHSPADDRLSRAGLHDAVGEDRELLCRPRLHRPRLHPHQAAGELPLRPGDDRAEGQ